MRKVTLSSIKLMVFLSLLVSCIFPMYSATTKIFDQANLLSSSEKATLQTQMDELINTYQIDIGIVTTDSMNGKSSRTYADDFYDQNGLGIGQDYSGLLLLINMEDREVYISTCGEGIRYFTDTRIDSILDAMTNSLANQNYSAACTTFLSKVESNLISGIPSNQYTEPEGFKFSWSSTLLYLVISVIISFIICLCVSKSYKRPTSISGQAYLNHGSVHFTRKEDTFLGRHISKRKKESSNNSSSGGRSSTHTSSSGRSHGGGGKSF